MSLFEVQNYKDKTPCAEKLRPQSLQDFVGQKHILAAGLWLKEVAQGKARLSSMIFYGPPGTGKTSLAHLFSQVHKKSHFVSLNASDTGIKELKAIGEKGHQDRLERGQLTCLFIDEIHRLNRTQQDVLLPFVELNDLILIGATTENPSYELSPALLSRVRVFLFESLGFEDLVILGRKTLENFSVSEEEVFEKEIFHQVIHKAHGDARQLINSLELLIDYKKSRDSKIDLECLEKTLNIKLPYGGKKQEHYDCTSAFIKSMRGSDPDASVYYLARMLEGGEDPVFIARRLVIFASEDIGNSDPRALSVAVSGLTAVEAVGLPECGINLAHVTTYLASCPKSNRSYKSFLEAKKLVRDLGPLPIPKSLSSSSWLRKQNKGDSYKYSHDGEKGYIKQNFLPQEIQDVKLYEPSDRGFEKNIKEYLKWMKD